MTKHEEFLVPVEIAKELNEIGFDKPCFFSFNEEVIGEIPLSFGKFLIKCNDHKAHLNGVIYGDKKVTDSYPIPTYEQVFAWFREKGYQFQVGRVCFADEFIPEFWDNYYCEIYLKETDDTLKILTYTYEEARLDCIIELIKIYKENI